MRWILPERSSSSAFFSRRSSKARTQTEGILLLGVRVVLQMHPYACSNSYATLCLYFLSFLAFIGSSFVGEQSATVPGILAPTFEAAGAEAFLNDYGYQEEGIL